MTRKDYIAIAALVRGHLVPDAVPLSPESDGNVAVELLAASLADLFEQGNPQFDRARFLKACGISE